MLCPGLRLGAYLPVQAKHPATQAVGVSANKRSQLNILLPISNQLRTNESNLLQSQPPNIWGVKSSQYIILIILKGRL